MAFDFDKAFGKAEEFVRRHFKPKAVQEAEKRRKQRKLRDAGRRLRNSTMVVGASGAGVIGYGLAVAPMGAAALATAGAATLLAAGTALLWPRRAEPAGISREELIHLLSDAEEWLLERRATIPGRAIPAFDVIFLRINDLHPRIADADPNAPFAWDLRRLLGDHLPRLVHSYTELPETVRTLEPELLQRLIDGLGTLDEELVRICREANRHHLTAFEAQERFIDIRYKDRGLERE